MQRATTTIQNLRNAPKPPPLLSLFHATSLSFARGNSKLDDSEPHIRFSVREKRPNTSRSLKNVLLNKNSKDEGSARHGEGIGSRRKDSPHSHSKNSNRSKSHTSSYSGRGKHNTGKRWRSKKHFSDEDDYEWPKKTFTATIDGQKCYTWSFGSWNNFQGSTSDYKWGDRGDDAKREKAKKRVWNESDVEDEEAEEADIDIGSDSHRVALGLPLTGPLKLDDVKSAFRASALKWHPDKHHGPSQAIAEERFKLCVNAYNSLCNALKSA